MKTFWMEAIVKFEGPRSPSPSFSSMAMRRANRGSAGGEVVDAFCRSTTGATARVRRPDFRRRKCIVIIIWPVDARRFFREGGWRAAGVFAHHQSLSRTRVRRGVGVPRHVTVVKLHRPPLARVYTASQIPRLPWRCYYHVLSAVSQAHFRFGARQSPAHTFTAKQKLPRASPSPYHPLIKAEAVSAFRRLVLNVIEFDVFVLAHTTHPRGVSRIFCEKNNYTKIIIHFFLTSYESFRLFQCRSDPPTFLYHGSLPNQYLQYK